MGHALLRMKPPGHIIIAGSPQVTLGLTLSGRPVSLGKAAMTDTHHYSIIQSGLRALKVLCAPPAQPSPSPSVPHCSLDCLRSFAFFQRVIQMELYSVWPFQTGFFH